MSLISELRRRNVFRVVLAHAAAARLLVEVMDPLIDIYEAPSRAMKSLVAAVRMGIVPAVILAWFCGITADRVRKQSHVLRQHAPAPGRQLNIVVAVMFAVAIGFFAAARLGTDIGRARAAEQAVDCLRTGLAEPSPVIPLLQLYFPYCDSIRADPAFLGLFAELEGSAKAL
jgi:hypothetical protein